MWLLFLGGCILNSENSYILVKALPFRMQLIGTPNLKKGGHFFNRILPETHTAGTIKYLIFRLLISSLDYYTINWKSLTLQRFIILIFLRAARGHMPYPWQMIVAAEMVHVSCMEMSRILFLVPYLQKHLCWRIL